MPPIIDSDQHLYEYQSLWQEHIDPALRAEAIRFQEDRLGNVRLMWRDQVLTVADVQLPGETDAIGDRRRRERAGKAPLIHYDEALPQDYWDPISRLERLKEFGVDEALLFPNYGLAWERKLQPDLPALCGNMRAWNRWCEAVAEVGRGRLHPVAHLTLRDIDWLETELARISRAGVRTAMIAPALVDGKPLSHPDLDRAWAAFAHHAVSPIFHVADQPRPFDDGWYTEEGDLGVAPVDAVLLHVGASLACTDLILNGVLDRYPALRLGIVELSAVWVPLYLMMLDGGHAFVRRLDGRDLTLAHRPSDYFRRQVRVSSFAYELPLQIQSQLGGSDLLMCCSDYPHSEGTADPVADYTAGGRYAARPEEQPGLFGGNAAFLLHRDE